MENFLLHRNPFVKPVFAAGDSGDNKDHVVNDKNKHVDGTSLVDEVPRIDINKPKWEQSTYMGRAKHFINITNPLNIFKSNSQLEEAKRIVHAYQKGDELPGVTVNQLWKAKHIYDSAYHPETGEKMVVIGRMSAQVPMNMLIGGGMLTWYKTTPQVLLWQWINQTFNATVNYTNRSGKHPIPTEHLAQSYVLATTGAVGVAMGLNKMVAVFPPVVGRLVPMAAISAAHAVNIPMMRRKELAEGIMLLDENGKEVGVSKVAAVDGIFKVFVSRISMAGVYMMTIPFYMDHLERSGFLIRYPWSTLPIQVLLCGVGVAVATPLCCALFPQMSWIKVSRLEKELQEKVSSMPNQPKRLQYNRGL